MKNNNMIIVKVSYTVKTGFVQQNQDNIHRFLADFKNMDPDTFQYTVYLGSDGQTFTHLSSYRDAEIQKSVLETPSFKDFQQQRDDSGLLNEPMIEVMQMVGSSTSSI